MSATETQPRPILVAESVRKVYRSGADSVVALHGLDLVVPQGEFLAVMGPSGSGKTTLLNCVSGLDEIDDGRVLVDGLSIHELSDRARTRHRAKEMGFIFQAFNLIPVFTATENVELPCCSRECMNMTRVCARGRRWRASASAIGSTGARWSFPVASSSVWP